MTKISIFTTMTDPEKRNDPWRESLNCYEDFADELVVVGKDWPKEFKWDIIGKIFQEGFDLSTGDWVIRMDLDYFFHEKDLTKLRTSLNKFNNYPAVSFPQYQIFTPDRYQIKTRICVAFNKKFFPQIKLNGGGDLTLATLNNELIEPKKVPMINIPIYQYESSFRTKEIIAKDRARFARAWFNYFGNYGDRGGQTPELAYKAWFKMIQERYKKHTFKIKDDQHPKYIKEKLIKISNTQFAYDAFGLKNTTSRPLKNYLSGYREKYINPLLAKPDKPKSDFI